jgi:fatty acid desaturase
LTITAPSLARRMDPGPRGSDYAALSRRVKSAGLLERRATYYIVRIVVVGLLFAAGWTAVVLLGSSWYQLIVAAFLAAVFTQFGFIGHDAGHGQVFRSARANRVLGLIHGNAGIGLSYGWWINKHTRHHAHPNDPEKDPDVAAGVLVFVAGGANGRRRLAALWTRSQAFLFFPLLLLEGMNLHVASIRDLIRPGRRSRWLELGLLLLHIAGLFGFYMGCSFAPNHKGMPSLDAVDSSCFLRRQVLTSRNIRGGFIVDTVFGGLNYQIEHHLFPSMPRPNLRRAQVLVREFCADHRIAYRETGILRSYAEALRHLHEVGAPLRVASADSVS